MTTPKTVCIRIICCILCLLCVFALALPAAALQEVNREPAEQTLTAKVHNWPSRTATVIGQMENGTAITVLGEYGDFYQIDCYDMTGYIAKEQVTFRENNKSYVNCDTDSDETQVMAYTSLAEALTLRHSLLALARKQLGYPYVYGGTRPGGFDCSGFTYYLYGEHDMPIHRTASQQLQDGIIIAKEGLQIGDLVFFRVPEETTAASHVGIYVGNNQIIHAGSKGICYANLDSSYFYDNYLCARRIVNTAAAELGLYTVPCIIGLPGMSQGVSGRKAG